MDAEDVVVSGEHVHGGGGDTGGDGDSNLRVINAREVASAGRLVLFGLERERVRVDTGVRRTSVMVVGLHLVEVLTLLLLEAVLTVEDKLEVGERTSPLLGELVRGTALTAGKEGRTIGGGRHKHVGAGDGGGGLHLDIVIRGRSGEVPHGVLRLGVGEAPHQFLDGVIVREADLLGVGSIDGIRTSVLNLLDEVLVTLLGESATLFGVQVDVVGPHLEGGGVKPFVEVRGQIEIQTDFMVLQGNQRQVQTGVAVEEEVQGQVHSLTGDTGGHLTVSSLLGLIQVKLRVQTPPLLVLFVDALTTDGKLNVVDGTLGNPSGVSGSHTRGLDLEFDVHVTDEITVTGDSDGDATGVGGSTVDGLLDVLHREVRCGACIWPGRKLPQGYR